MATIEIKFVYNGQQLHQESIDNAEVHVSARQPCTSKTDFDMK